MKIIPLIFVAAVISSPLVAAPVDDVAVQTGKAAGSYNRAKKLCREAGFTMPEVQEVNPALLRVFLKVMADHDELFWYGYGKGEEEATDYLKAGSDTESICEKYRAVITPKK